MGMHEDGPWAMGQGEGAGAMEGWPTRSVRRLASSEEVPLGRGRADHSIPLGLYTRLTTAHLSSKRSPERAETLARETESARPSAAADGCAVLKKRTWTRTCALVSLITHWGSRAPVSAETQR